jgi:hypothetical protein
MYDRDGSSRTNVEMWAMNTKYLMFVGKFYVSWCPDVIEHQKWENTNIFVQSLRTWY